MSTSRVKVVALDRARAGGGRRRRTRPAAGAGPRRRSRCSSPSTFDRVGQEVELDALPRTAALTSSAYAGMSLALAAVDDVDLAWRPGARRCGPRRWPRCRRRPRRPSCPRRRAAVPGEPAPALDQADLAQEVGAVQHAGLLLAGDAQLAALVRADGEDDRVVAVPLEQVVQR